MEKAINSSLRKLPLTKYDFFGYFLPGFVFIFSILFYEYLCVNDKANFEHYYFLNFFRLQINFINLNQKIWIYPLVVSLIDIFIIYIVGHIISSVSSLFIDRILIYKAYGYPYEFLLTVEKEKDQSSIFSHSEEFIKNRFSPEKRSFYSHYFYTSVYFYINLFFIYLFSKNFIHLQSRLIDYLFIVILLFLLITKIVIETKFYKNKLKRIIPNYIKNIFIFIFRVLLPLPYSIFSSTLSKYLNTQRGFSEEFINLYKNNFKKIFKNLDPEKQSTNNFWLPYCYILKESPEHSELLTNWLHLYSFARNISTSFYLVFLYILINYIIKFYSVPANITHNFIYILPLINFLLSILMLIRFYYLYVNYYTKFLFRSFVTLSTLNYFEYNKNQLTKSLT